ncbi:MAG: hypothetical protein JXR46_10525 [Calditrichaceae bacterium]|nr:hypothetical protein [Calditrichaceae bacterium]MBN2709470.1 hypothetical protein [Calditrichaceae bacterium]
MKKNYWKIAFWILFFSWVTGASLFIARVKAGFFTNYLSDLTFPPWFYIYIRGLSTSDYRIPQLILFRDWFGISPERAFISILFVGTITELKTLYWPTGIISGTFDPIDILSYSVGLLLCYYLDKKEHR